MNHEIAENADATSVQSSEGVYLLSVTLRQNTPKKKKKGKYIPVGNGITISRAAVSIFVPECAIVEEGKVAK